MITNNMLKYRGEIGLFIVAIIWGSGFVASDISLIQFNPYTVMAVRFLIGAIVLSLVFYKKLKTLDSLNLKYGVVLGFILYSAFLLQTIGLSFTTPSKNAFLTAVNVIVVPFIGFFLYKAKLDRYGIISAFLSLIGIAVISFNFDLSINIGDVFTILCAFLFALHIFFTGEFLKRDTDAITLTIIQLITSAVIALVINFIVNGMNLYYIVSSKTSLLACVYLGLFSTCVAFLLQTVSQTYTNQTKTAVILCTESVFGSLFSVIILKEVLTVRLIIGSFIIFVAILISELKPKFMLAKQKG